MNTGRKRKLQSTVCGTMTHYHGFLSVTLVAAILAGVAVLAVLTSVAFDVLDWPRRHTTAFFFACLLVIWAGACLVIALARS